jgi:N-acetylmuramoyl-L-alanine amidase
MKNPRQCYNGIIMNSGLSPAERGHAWHLPVIALIFTLAAIVFTARFVIPAIAIERHTRTLEDLRTNAILAATTTPAHRKIRVLVVPGHEPNAGGTAYGALWERSLNVELGKYLRWFLGTDGRYETILSRDERGWNPEIAEYFSAHWDEIDAWRKEARAEMEALIASGAVPKPVVHVGHNDARPDVAVRLYGITKWANENDIDVVVHVHFDDDRASNRAPGRRTGFAIYVPPPEYFNAAPTQAIAEKIRARLGAFDPISDLPGVGAGIVEDPELIAVGQQNTSDQASLLIEYAFIYERQLQTPAVRRMAIEDMAYQTFLGLEDFFFGGPPIPRPSGTTLLPHAWTGPVGDGGDPADVYALQTALTRAGDYPPPGRDRNDCPRGGVFDDCTREALKRFQERLGITGEDEVAGKKTFGQLDAL